MKILPPDEQWPAVSPASPLTVMMPPALSQPTSADVDSSMTISVPGRHIEPVRWPAFQTWKCSFLPSGCQSGPPMSCWPEALISKSVSPCLTASPMARSRSWVDMRSCPFMVSILNIKLSSCYQQTYWMPSLSATALSVETSASLRPIGSELLPIGAMSFLSSASKAST